MYNYNFWFLICRTSQMLHPHGYSPSRTETKKSIVNLLVLARRKLLEEHIKLYSKNLNPFFAASPGTPCPAETAPSTCSPLSNFLLSLIKIVLNVNAIIIAITAVAQFTLIATTYLGPAELGYMYDA
jgi:hypothetical protein